MITSTKEELVEYFSDKLFTSVFTNNQPFNSIIDARKSAEVLLGERVVSGTPLAKQVDEAIEAGVVRAARKLIEDSSTPQQTYERLVKLYEQQPALNVRTSTSVSQQAYSTPTPIAYLATTLAGINENSLVYEPSAGNGSLLIGTNPEKATVNELNPDRAAALRAQGFSVTEQDATTYVPDTLHDVVIMNPPFGSLKEGDGRAKQFATDYYRTTQIDHAIALNALKAMKPNGKAVLILGGKLGDDEQKRSDRYNSLQSRAFYHTLYKNYNVTEHFTIWGDLYRKQGAGFPIDVMVIEGRGKSHRSLPAVAVPHIYKSFDSLGGFFNEFLLSQSKRLDTTRGGESAGSTRARGRDNDREPGVVSELSSTSAGLADRAVDGELGRISEGSGAEIRPDNKPVDSISINPINDGQRDRGDHSTSRMAAGMGRGDSVSQRHNPGEIGVARSRVSRERDHRQGGEGVTAMDVQEQQGDSRANAGGVVKQSDSASAGGLDVAASSQVAYIPHSKGQSVGSLVPVNMQTAIDQALDKLEQKVGAVDEYVADRLQYGNSQKLHQYFSAEQVDALALAIANIEQESGFVIGDQTGIGKGRVGAGIIRYAKLSGKTPIFVTKDPALYADMIRDLGDINMPRFEPFVTNQDLKAIPLPDGRVLKTSAKSHQRKMDEMQENGSLDSYDGIFTTYSQMQTVKGRETPRREFLRTFAPDSIIILDESHEAGGDANGKRKALAAPNRADFARELTQLASGVLYSSATYAKRPDVMDLYHRTNMRSALPNMSDLSELVQRGGIPMQQALATTLTHDGQYTRRERSFEGTSFTSDVVPVNKESAENISLIMRRITDFDKHKQGSIKRLDKELKAEAKAVSSDSAVGKAGVSSTNFTSVMHNLVGQMLLSLKAEATVQKALEALGKDEKPVIALSNTMGSFIGEYAEQQELQPGDVIDGDFGDLLRRYLERSREIMVGSPYGKKERRRLSDEELGAEGVAEYNAILELIDDTDLSSIPISPIDYITQRLAEKGYQVREITGREHIVEYNADGRAYYQRRSGSERSKTSAVKHVADFNSGSVDAIILNRSGSTGISLHASEKFADQRRRHMMITQPELDINLFMQTLGRVHRTGQVVPPAFSLLVADIPAEKRPSAVLAKKMASLNANTTAARSSGASLEEIPDFFNQYGNQVVADIMTAYPTVHEQLGFPLKKADEGLETEDAVRKVTGRLPLLPLAEQEHIYDLIEHEYRDLVAQQTALGESILEAQSLDLDAQTVAKMKVEPADPGSTSPFTGAVYLEVVDAKTQRKPYTTLEAVNKVRQNLDLSALKRLPKDYDFGELENLGQDQTKTLLTSLDEQVEQYKTHLEATVKPAAFERAIRNLEYQLPFVRQALTEFPVGTTVRLRTNRSDQTLFGVVNRVRRIGNEKGNPAAPSSWKMQFLLADGAREITVPLSQLNTSGENAITVTPFNDAELAYSLFDKHRGRAREERQIFTGNLLRAFGKFPNTQVINYTDCYGNTRTGLLTKQDFDIEKALEVQPVQMRSVEEAAKVLRSGYGYGELQTLDRLLTVKSRGRGDEYVLQTPKAKAVGGKYFLNSDLLAAVESDFVSVGKRMECAIPADRLEPVLKAMYDNQWRLAAFEDQAQVRSQLGVELPELEKVEEPAPEPTQKLPSSPLPSESTQPKLPLEVVNPMVVMQQQLDRVAPATGDYYAGAHDNQKTENVSLEQLRNWYRAARDMELGQEKLSSIRQIGLDAKANMAQGQQLQLSASSITAMEQDLEQYQQFQERGEAIAQAASVILKTVGKQTAGGTQHFKGSVYELTKTPDALSVVKRQEGKTPTKILEMKNGQLERSQVSKSDCQNFLRFVQTLQKSVPTRQVDIQR
ncbi:MAG: DEAD/DEAH box helicase family protein [Symploca sp. SIO2G7]|nr:DEAD/DEAH box helicase family protein [Symploca sp. SIO2G7]